MLNEKLQAALDAARKALADGDLETAKAKRLEAEGIIAQIEEAKALDVTASRYAPTRPTLPGTDGTALVPEIAGSGTGDTKSTAVAVADDDDDDDGDLGVKTQRAAYQTRFGDEAKTIKSILTELHGPNYRGAYWAQKASFNRYLRGGETGLLNDDRKRLREVVMNPMAVKMALDQGSDIAALRATMVEAADQLGGLTWSGVQVTCSYSA